jgi:hypothetical protein
MMASQIDAAGKKTGKKNSRKGGCEDTQMNTGPMLPAKSRIGGGSLSQWFGARS